jgi:hypothetical protein
LKFLRISHLPSLKKKCVINEKARSRYLLEKNKNIKYVNLEYISKFDQVQFTIYLCPFMQQFIITCINDIDLLLLVQFILCKNAKFVKYLILLCLSTPSVDDEMIKKLQKMISIEKYNYSIERMDNKIYLHRKL